MDELDDWVAIHAEYVHASKDRKLNVYDQRHACNRSNVITGQIATEAAPAKA